jgi:hypothetical protein
MVLANSRNKVKQALKGKRESEGRNPISSRLVRL